ncbi:MAG: hypothetical protein WBP16_16150 [Ferruginibacter sp.]
MKKYILILIMLAGGFSWAFAQDNQGADDQSKQEKIQALYVAYVSQQLQFTPDEAQKFWPVHTQFTAELKGIRKDLPELEKQQARLDIKKKYQDNFSKIIGASRCERFFRMETEFREKLKNRVNNNPRQNQRPKVRRNN